MYLRLSEKQCQQHLERVTVTLQRKPQIRMLFHKHLSALITFEIPLFLNDKAKSHYILKCINSKL